MQSKPCNLNTIIISRVICNIYIINIGRYILIDHNHHHQILLPRFSENFIFGTLDQNKHFVCFKSLSIFFLVDLRSADVQTGISNSPWYMILSSWVHLKLYILFFC